MDADDLARVKVLLSEERLRTFRDLTHSDEAAIQLHQATMVLGASLMAVCAMLEIALRNAVCVQLSTAFGRQDWLRNPPAPFRWSSLEKNSIERAVEQAQRAAYSKLSDNEKRTLNATAFPQTDSVPPADLNHRRIAKSRQKTITVPDSQIIAQLTLFFWKRLFAGNYEVTLWRRALKRVFPNKRYSRAQIAVQLEVLYETRNRLAHHEPVYGARLESILQAIEFISENLDARRPSANNTLAKLVAPQRQSLDVMVVEFKDTFDRLTA